MSIYNAFLLTIAYDGVTLAMLVLFSVLEDVVCKMKHNLIIFRLTYIYSLK